jgi:hypothetical protein
MPLAKFKVPSSREKIENICTKMAADSPAFAPICCDPAQISVGKWNWMIDDPGRRNGPFLRRKYKSHLARREIDA